MAMLLQAQSNAVGSSVITLVDPTGADTGYRVLDGLNWGDAIREVIYSGPKGTQGSGVAGGTPQNRIVNIPLRVTGSSKDDLLAKISTIEQWAEETRRLGGILTWRSKNGSHKVYFDVLA